MPGPIHHPSRGFTLVEICMVILIIGIVASAVMPMMEPTVYDRLEGTAQVVASDLAYVRGLAIANNSTYRVTFDLASNKYYFEHSGANSALNTLPRSALRMASEIGTRQSTLVGEAIPAGGTVRLLAVASLQAPIAPRTQLEFRNWGQTTQTTDTIIWLSTGQGREQRFIPVTVSALTGLASVGEFTGTGPTSAMTSGS